jgi:hypothetical protein
LVVRKEVIVADGLGVIVSQGLKLYWVEGALFTQGISHQTIISRMGWDNTNDGKFLRFYARVQVPEWKIGNFQWDDGGTIPAWAEKNVEDVKDAVYKLLAKVNPLRDAFMKKVKALEKERDMKLIQRPEDDMDNLMNQQVSEKYQNLINQEYEKLMDEYKKIDGYLPDPKRH